MAARSTPRETAGAWLSYFTSDVQFMSSKGGAPFDKGMQELCLRYALAGSQNTTLSATAVPCRPGTSAARTGSRICSHCSTPIQ